MSAIQGKLMGLKVNGVFISCEVSSDISFQGETLPATAIDSGGWKEFLSGLRSWSMNVNGQLLAEAVGADFKTIFNSFVSRNPILLTWSTRPSATTALSLTGTAIVASGSATGPNKGNSTWTVAFQGTGALVPSFQDFALIIDAMPPEATYPIIFDLDVT